jgi:hypothetical protein
MSATAERPNPGGRNSPNYVGALQLVIRLAEETWPTPPHLCHLTNPPPSHTWDPLTAEYHTQAIARVDVVDSQSRQTARWSGVSPGRSHGHASRAQERTPPKCEPPPVDDYIQELEQMEAKGYGPQTASGVPSCRHGVAPRTDTTGRTQPRETARRGGGM